MKRWIWTTLLASCWAVPAAADGSVGVFGRATNVGEGALIDARWRTGGAQLGVEAYVGREREAFVSGYAVDDAVRIDAALLGIFEVWNDAPAAFSLVARVGMRRLRSGEGNAEERSSWAITAELGALLHADVHPRVVLRTGLLVPLAFQVAPEFSNDVNGALLMGGLAIELRRGLHLTGDLDLGGIFGADGDAGKFLARGTLGLRWARNWRHF